MYHQTCDVKTMCYIVFISHSLHWHYIKTALQEYVINPVISTSESGFINFLNVCFGPITLLKI